MNIKRKKDNSNLVVTVSGRIDTATAPTFEAGVTPYLDGITDLTLDFKDVKHYQSIIHVLQQTARIMQEIDNNGIE